VQDQQIKEQIASTAMIGKGNQYRTRDCSALAVFCSDLQPTLRIQRILQMERNHCRNLSKNASSSSQPPYRHPDYLATMPISTSFMFGEGHLATLLKQATMGYISSNTKQAMPEIDPVRVWAYKNTSLMVQSYVLAATSYQLQTSIMEGYDPRRIKDLLHIPSDRYGIPMVVAMGYEYRPPVSTTTDVDDDTATIQSTTARLNVNEVVFQNTFGVPIQFETSTSGSEPEQ
jgi:nitroreductase